MLELSETDTCLGDSHSVRELDADGDLLVDVGHPVSGVFERMPDRIVHLTLLGYFIRFCLDLRLFVCGNSSHCYRINFLMRLPIPFVESRIVRSSSARLARPRTPLSRCSSEGPRTWSNARLCRFYQA